MYRTARPIACLLGGIVAMALAASASGEAAGQTAIRTLADLLSHCTAAHGYSVKAGEGLGDFELGEGELAWRDCVYDGIRATIIPDTPTPDLFEALIAKDKALTAEIHAGTTTRKERRTRVMQAIATIQESEATHLVKRERQMRAQAKTEQAIREVQDILDLQERLFEVRRAALEGLR